MNDPRAFYPEPPRLRRLIILTISALLVLTLLLRVAWAVAPELVILAFLPAAVLLFLSIDLPIFGPLARVRDDAVEVRSWLTWTRIPLARLTAVQAIDYRPKADQISSFRATSLHFVDQDGLSRQLMVPGEPLSAGISLSLYLAPMADPHRVRRDETGAQPVDGAPPIESRFLPILQPLHRCGWTPRTF